MSSEAVQAGCGVLTGWTAAGSGVTFGLEAEIAAGPGLRLAAGAGRRRHDRCWAEHWRGRRSCRRRAEPPKLPMNEPDGLLVQVHIWTWLRLRRRRWLPLCDPPGCLKPDRRVSDHRRAVRPAARLARPRAAPPAASPMRAGGCGRARGRSCARGCARGRPGGTGRPVAPCEGAGRHCYTHRSFVARTAAWTRFRTSSLRRISWMCVFTVFSLR